MSASNTKASRLTVSLAALTLCVFCAHTSAQTPQRPRTAATPDATPTGTPSPAVSPSPASTPDASQPATPARAVSEDEADLAITANVTARELKFEVVPNTAVEFTGKPERVTNWEAERTNLPRPVQPGVTYRDIGIRLKIVSVFADIDRIVAEALGEVPESDDAPPATAALPAIAAPPATAPAAPATPSNETPDKPAATSTGDAETNASNTPTETAARASAARVASPRRAAARPRARRLP